MQIFKWPSIAPHRYYRPFLRPFPSSTISDNTPETGAIRVVAPQPVEEPMQTIAQPVDEEVQAILEPVEEPVPISPPPLVEGAVRVTPPRPAEEIIEVFHPQPAAEETQPVERVTADYLLIPTLAFSHAYRIDTGLCVSRTAIAYRDCIDVRLCIDNTIPVDRFSNRSLSFPSSTIFHDGFNTLTPERSQVALTRAPTSVSQHLLSVGLDLGQPVSDVSTEPPLPTQVNRFATDLAGEHSSSEDTTLFTLQ
ncbi:hypothetical protein EDB84DRAFT_1567270 [Lactarius hengduanensis]|nr:hypothetical protein EDB84DRAFT_1567270 [Lactarius hengduanensis]